MSLNVVLGWERSRSCTHRRSRLERFERDCDVGMRWGCVFVSSNKWKNRDTWLVNGSMAADVISRLETWDKIQAGWLWDTRDITITYEIIIANCNSNHRPSERNFDSPSSTENSPTSPNNQVSPQSPHLLLFLLGPSNPIHFLPAAYHGPAIFSRVLSVQWCCLLNVLASFHPIYYLTRLSRSHLHLLYLQIHTLITHLLLSRYILNPQSNHHVWT